MINPIVIIVAAAVLMSVLVVCVLNKPKMPVITGALIFILICFVVMTYMIDNAISCAGNSGRFDSFVSFITMSDSMLYTQLEASFRTFMIFDIVLFAVSMLSLGLEAAHILKNYNKK